MDFYAPWIEFGGILLLFCQSVCVCVSVCAPKILHFDHNFCTVRDRDFIYGMHTLLMKLFQMTKINDLVRCDLDSDL